MGESRPVFLPWGLSGILMSWVLLVRGGGAARLAVVFGHCWATSDSPETAQPWVT